MNAAGLFPLSQVTLPSHAFNILLIWGHQRVGLEWMFMLKHLISVLYLPVILLARRQRIRLGPRFFTRTSGSGSLDGSASFCTYYPAARPYQPTKSLAVSGRTRVAEEPASVATPRT